MDLRPFQGHLVIDGRDGEPMELRIAISTAGGGTTGAGSFAMPYALVGAREDDKVTFRTRAGDEITLILREVDPIEGQVYFLTEGAVPATIGLAATG